MGLDLVTAREGQHLHALGSLLDAVRLRRVLVVGDVPEHARATHGAAEVVPAGGPVPRGSLVPCGHQAFASPSWMFFAASPTEPSPASAAFCRSSYVMLSGLPWSSCGCPHPQVRHIGVLLGSGSIGTRALSGPNGSGARAGSR